MKNLYLILGITKQATSQDIKKAYRKLAMDNHPDKGGDVDKMSLVNEAYEILSDATKRGVFDADWDIFQASDVDHEVDFTPAGLVKAGNIRSYSQDYKIQHKIYVAQYELEPMQKKEHESFQPFESNLYSIEEQGEVKAQYHDIFTFIQAKEATIAEKALFTVKDCITIAIAIKLLKDFLSGNYYGNALVEMKSYLASGIVKLKQSNWQASELALYEAIDEIVSMTHRASLEPYNLLLSLEKISDFAKDAANELLPSILPLLTDKYFRNLYKHALYLNWDLNNDLFDNNQSPSFDGLQETKELLQELRKRLSNEDKNENLSKYIQYITLLYKLEKDIHISTDIEPTAENYRNIAFHLMDWLPVFMGRSSEEIIVNIFLQIGLKFQQSSLMEADASIKQADETLALNMYVTAIKISQYSTPDIESYAKTQIIKYISAFQFEFPKLDEVILAFKERVLIIADVFPFFESTQSNVAFLKKENKSLNLMRNLLQAMIKRYEYNKNHSDGLPMEHSAAAILYSAYEACLLNWYQENHEPAMEKKFRLDLMDELLFENNWTFIDVEERLNSPWIMVNRDDKGWLKPTRSLPYPDESTDEEAFVTYRGINGAQVNSKTGEINFFMTPWAKDRPIYERVFSLFDLQEMLEKNIGGALFSLDLVDPNMQYHPFNLMWFAPSQLCDSELLNTMLLTDYMLKFLTCNQEVNGEHPFEQRPASSMIQHLPEYLRKIIDDFNAVKHIGALHRFWIEAGEIDISLSDKSSANDEDITTIGLGSLKMMVKKHKMERDKNGKLKDVEKEEEGWPIYVLTPEQMQALEQGERVINGHAMVYVYGKAQLFYWENHAVLHAHTPQDYRETLVRLFLQPRDNGQIKQTEKNSALLYRSTKEMSRQSGISHRYSPEFIFAHEFTTHYDEFAQYLPEFGRLKEFSKMSALIRILGDMHKKNQESLEALNFLLRTPLQGKPPSTDIYKQYHQSYQEICNNITSEFERLRLQVSTSVLKRKQRGNLNRINHQMEPLTFSEYSGQVEMERNRMFDNLSKANPLASYSRIWAEIPSQSNIAAQLTELKQTNVRNQLKALFPACSWSSINAFIQGDMEQLENELVLNVKKDAQQQIYTHYPNCSMQDIALALDDNGHAAAIRIAVKQAQNQLRPIKKFEDTYESGFAQVNFGKDDKDVNLSGQCFWVPASVRHEVKEDKRVGTSPHSFFVYGGVSIQSRVNINRGGSNVLGGSRVGKGAFNNVNAQAAMNNKLRALQKAQTSPAKIERFDDGRVRYYQAERASRTSGPTRGNAHVTEHNPKTGQVRTWAESYDHQGNVNRVHPKMIDGQNLKAQHYPPTGAEIRQSRGLK